MKRSHIVTFLLVALLLAACTTRKSGHERMLADLDSLSMVYPDSMVTLLQEMAASCEQSGDKQYLAQVYYLLGRTNNTLRNSEKALFYLQKALLQDSTHVTSLLRGRIYSQMGQILSRNSLFDDAKDVQELACFHFRQGGDSLALNQCLDNLRALDSLRLVTVVDSAVLKESKLAVMRVSDRLRSSVLEERNAKLQNNLSKRNRRLCVLGLAVGLAVLVGALTLRTQRRKSKTEEKAEGQTATRRQFYDKEIQDIISAHVKENRVLKSDDWDIIEQRILASYPGFKDQLFALYNLSDSEYRTCMLIKLGTSPSNMAKLMATSNSAISQCRLRMQQKVFGRTGTAKDWDKYILSL